MPREEDRSFMRSAALLSQVRPRSRRIAPYKELPKSSSEVLARISLRLALASLANLDGADIADLGLALINPWTMG
jgi:hypothetical protein